MIVLDCNQGESEWLSARVGIPTSSNFDKIITTKGERSKQYLKYLYTLAGERFIGKKEDTFQSLAMQKGIETEAEARAFYELTNGVEVIQCGICYSDDKKLWASSPDGLVGKDGLVEVKCPLLSTQVYYIVEGGLVEDYYQQLQGQLFVTGRKWVDIISYYPAMRPVIIRITPDPKFQKALAVELEVFVKRLDEITAKLKG